MCRPLVELSSCFFLRLLSLLKTAIFLSSALRPLSLFCVEPLLFFSPSVAVSDRSEMPPFYDNDGDGCGWWWCGCRGVRETDESLIVARSIYRVFKAVKKMDTGSDLIPRFTQQLCACVKKERTSNKRILFSLFSSCSYPRVDYFCRFFNLRNSFLFYFLSDGLLFTLSLFPHPLSLFPHLTPCFTLSL